MREILALPALADGVPEVLVGGDALEARVRWAHVSDSAGVARLLDGGELLLTTGSGWPTEPEELAGFIGGLVDAGLAGLVLELGAHYRYVPAVVAESAEARGLALVALHREVKFVALTEAVHGRIISAQTAALVARDEVRERFTGLALRGSPADFIVRQLAATLGSGVVLENLAHEVVSAEVAPSEEESLLREWEARSRRAHRGDAEGWLIVPVEARGLRWGHLVALPGPAHAAGRNAVLEQAATALAFGRLADSGGDEWARIGRQRLVDALLEGRFAALPNAAVRLEAAGLPVEHGVQFGVVVTGAEVPGERVDAAARALGGRALAGALAEGAAPASVLLLSLPESTRFAVDEAAVLAFGRSLVEEAAARERLVLSIGQAAHGLAELLASVQQARDLARVPVPRGARGPIVRRADDRPLVRLVTSLRDDHRLQEHGERMLAPLIEYDLARGGDLLDVLAAMLAHPGNRTAAASASHLSRSVFYQRIALIAELLDADLDDGETLTALHLALLVRRSGSR
ncbi:PucR family transcriptional regulator ligand-binding domain-containing protein [Agromyces mediolanus]|uniref:PucR family transcriptional regulator n=1 Tax=Agromyces mediolanus TaxID=41986 RepID=UPI0038343E79